jgi:hypothetical protein
MLMKVYKVKVKFVTMYNNVHWVSVVRVMAKTSQDAEMCALEYLKNGRAQLYVAISFDTETVTNEAPAEVIDATEHEAVGTL